MKTENAGNADKGKPAGGDGLVKLCSGEESISNQAQFLQDIHPQGSINVCILKKEEVMIGNSFISSVDEDDLLAYIATASTGDNVYFTPGNLKEHISRKPSKKDIESLSWVWADIDVKDFMSDGVNYDAARSALLSSVDAIKEKYKPTYIIDSGNGRQLFWRLSSVLSVEAGEALNRRIVAAVDGDASAVNADRIMAIPYTKKYQSKKKLKIGYPDKIMETSVVYRDPDAVFDEGLFPPQEEPMAAATVAGIAEIAEPEMGSQYHEECRAAWERKLQRKENNLSRWMDGEDPNGDASAGDLVVCNHMAFMFRSDKVLMDKVFRESKRMRPKWDTIHSGGGGLTYGQMTINKACIDTVEVRAYPQSTFEELSNEYIMLDYEGQTLIVSMNQKKVLQFTKIEDLTKLKSNKYAYDKFGLPIGKTNKSEEFKHYKAVSEWLDHPQRRTYRGVDFLPIPWLVNKGKLNDDSTLNLYTGLAFEPKAGQCNLIEKHILNIWCDGSKPAYEYMMNWMAMMFQNPAEPAYTVPVLISKEGAGKNIITDILADAFGEHASLFNSPSDITGRFNERLGTSVLVLLNEATTSDLHGKESRGKLKSLITDKLLPIEAKYKKPIWVKNRLHLMVTTNDDAPITMDESDRRFFILKMNDSRRRDSEYFKALRGQIDSGGREAFIHSLQQRNIKGFNPRIIPQHCIAERAEIKAYTYNILQHFWSDCLHRCELGGFGISGTVLLSEDEWKDNPESKVGKTEFYDEYMEFARYRQMKIQSHKMFTQFMQGENVGMNEYRNNAKRHYIVPNFHKCEEAWTEANDGDYSE